MQYVKIPPSGFMGYWNKANASMEGKETVEQFQARGGQIQYLKPEETSGNPMNEWRSSYDDV